MNKTISSLLLIASLTGCSSVPQEVPELSVELGKRISSIEQANIALLNIFFEQKRQDIDEFIDEVWLPQFAKNFFEEPFIEKQWDRIVESNNKEDRLIFLMKVGPRLQKLINDKRKELIAPLNLLEKDIERKIRTDYLQAKNINNSITNFLLSTSKLAENREKLLTMFGVENNEVVNIVNETDAVIMELINKGKSINGKIDQTQNYLDKLKSIKNKL